MLRMIGPACVPWSMPKLPDDGPGGNIARQTLAALEIRGRTVQNRGMSPTGANRHGASMTDNVSAEQLRLFIERIETLEEEKKGIADDIKDVYAEAKGTGFDTKTMRAIVRLRKMEASARQEAEALLDTYKTALGLAD
jgi:uncharacterized protein (UPF0335 family)